MASWAARHTEWTANTLVRADIEMVDESIIKVRAFEAHTRESAPTKLAAFAERILARAREEEPAKPRWKVGWLRGTVGADIMALESDAEHPRYGTWTHSPDSETGQNRNDLKATKYLIKEPNFKVVGRGAREIGATRKTNGERSTACRQKAHDSGLAPSLWTVKLDSRAAFTRT